MTARITLIAVTGLWLAGSLPSPVAAQEIPRTSWGVPDLRGTWDFRTVTPFERPESFRDQEFLTVDEVDEFEEAVRRGREERAQRTDYTQSQGDVDVGYNSFFIDSGTRMSLSLIHI